MKQLYPCCVSIDSYFIAEIGNIAGTNLYLFLSPTYIYMTVTNSKALWLLWSMYTTQYCLFQLVVYLCSFCIIVYRLMLRYVFCKQCANNKLQNPSSIHVCHHSMHQKSCPIAWLVWFVVGIHTVDSILHLLYRETTFVGENFLVQKHCQRQTFFFWWGGGTTIEIDFQATLQYIQSVVSASLEVCCLCSLHQY